MMNLFESTNLPFLQEDCEKQFADSVGTRIYSRAEERYQRLTAKADDKGNTVIREHLHGRLFPAMAYYQALLAEGIPQKEALAFVKQETQKAAEKNKEKNAQMARMPFAFLLYRMGVKSYMKKSFPAEGWQTEWVRCNADEIHFNLHQCIYWDLCQQHGCPELCTVYCANDVTAFSGLMPKIRFERTGTLGEGAKYCDFHFVKNH
jgi:hypothetical protein